MQDKLAFSLTRYDGSVAARAVAAALCNRGGYRIVVWPATNCIRASAKRDKVAAAPPPAAAAACKKAQALDLRQRKSYRSSYGLHTYLPYLSQALRRDVLR